MTANTDQAKKITVLINQKPYHLETDEATGRELKALAGIPEENLLFLEVPGPGDDVPVPDDEETVLKPGSHLYDMPRGNFGCRP